MERFHCCHCCTVSTSSKRFWANGCSLPLLPFQPSENRSKICCSSALDERSFRALSSARRQKHVRGSDLWLQPTRRGCLRIRPGLSSLSSNWWRHQTDQCPKRSHLQAYLFLFFCFNVSLCAVAAMEAALGTSWPLFLFFLFSCFAVLMAS